MYSDTHPIHVLKFCPKCGCNDFRPTGSRSFLCPCCGFNYYINASAAVAGIIHNSLGEILFTRRAIEPHRGMLDLPGGFVDPMETAEAAIIREIREELGAEVSSLKYLCSFPNQYVFSGFTVFTLDLAFELKVNDLKHMKAMDDISAFEFHQPELVNLDELPSVSMRNILKEIIKRKHHD